MVVNIQIHKSMILSSEKLRFWLKMFIRNVLRHDVYVYLTTSNIISNFHRQFISNNYPLIYNDQLLIMSIKGKILIINRTLELGVRLNAAINKAKVN